jgi:electron transport complex protein RnfG
VKKFVSESWLVLLMGVAFAALLATTHSATSDRIRENERQELNAAVTEVVPDMDVGRAPETLRVADHDVYRCLDADGALAGWAVDATGGGFVDKIRLVVGLSPDGGTITGVKVIGHLETPGLGNKIETRGEENFYPLQFRGKSAGRPMELVKRTPAEPYEIQAITGATYSSQYVMDIVNTVIARVVPELPGS